MAHVLLWIALADAPHGYLLEDETGIVSYESERGRVVPVFATRDDAIGYARASSMTVDEGPPELHELAPLVAFASGDRAVAPPGSLDDWILLDEIAFAAGNDAIPSPHDHEDGLREDALPSARDAARSAIRRSVDAVRAVLVRPGSS